MNHLDQIKYYKGERIEVLPVEMKYCYYIRKKGGYLELAPKHEITDGLDIYIKELLK